MSSGEHRVPGRHDESSDGTRLSAALPYVPGVLVRSLSGRASTAFPWSDEVDGTLAMADISGFTAMSEQLARSGREGAEQLTDIITSFFTSMLDRARLFDGDIITYGGDAMLLLFMGKEHERRAVAASLEMLDAMRALPPFRVGRARIRLGMSMGAHSDRFPVFGAGTTEHAQFFILGPATVRTAECEALASSGELVVSAETRSRCAGMSATEVGEGLFRVDGLAPRPAHKKALTPSRALCSPVQLLPYLPPFVADAIAQGTEPPALDSDHRKVSIVFVNVLGVDELLAEGREVLAEQLQAYVTVLLKVLERHEGYLVSNDIYTNGFKLIIAFGAPVALEDDAEQAVRFSIELRDAINATDLRLQQRIGVNRGDVFAGDVGPRYRRQYTVMGDAVNLSARLMSAANAGAAMTTHEVARTAGECFSNTALAPIRVKGKSQPIDVCLLEAEVGEQGLPSAQVGEVPFVGRDAELLVVSEAATRAQAGERRVAAVLGDAGMGKSRLVIEAIRNLEDRGWSAVFGISYQHTSAMPFTPWIEVIKQLLRLRDCASPESAGERVLEALERYAPRDVELAGLVGQLLDLPIPETERSRSLDAVSRREALFDLVAAIIAGVAGDSPVCVVLEDLHWADSSSLELLAHIASSPSSGESLLVLATSRRESDAESEIRSLASDLVDLAALEDESALRLVSFALGVQIPAEFAAMLLRKSKGNPLFLQEVARSIVQTGTLERILSAASAVAVEEVLAAIDIPDRVQGLLMSRVDRLDPGRRELLRTASVIGATFALDDVFAIAEEQFTGGDEVTLRRFFDDLIVMQFLEPVRDTGEADDLRFSEPLLQEVTYNSLRFARRRALHRMYAEHLERLPDQGARLGALVLHYSRAGERGKTALYGVKAADRAARLFAHREAVDYSRAALAAIKGSTPPATWERSCVMERVGDEHEQWGHHRDAIRCYRDALKRWTRIEDDYTWSPPGDELGQLLDETPRGLRRAVLCRKIAESHEHDGRRYDLANEWLDQALAALPEACTGERARVLVRKAFVATRYGHYDEAVRFGRTALAEATSCGDSAQRAMALMALCGSYDGMGELEKAIECQIEAVSILEDLGDLPRLSVAHGNLASCYNLLGQLEAARRQNEACLELDERLGSVSSAAITRVNLAETLIEQGHFDEARECLTKAFASCDEIGAVGLTGYAYIMSSRLYAAEGALEAAHADLNRAIEMLTRVNARGPLLEAYIDDASLALQSGDLRGTARAIERAEREDESLRAGYLSIRLDRAKGILASRQGRFSEAHDALSRSIDLARVIKARYELALSILAMADVAALAPSAGDEWPEHRSAHDFVAEAIPLLRECGAEADLGRAFELQDRVRMQSLGESALARSLAESGAPEVRFEAGTLVVTEGELGREMYLIRSGVVRVFRGRGVDEFTLGLLGPGDFFGEMSLIEEAQRSASVRAVTDVNLVVLDKARFDEVVSDPISREIIGRMSDRIRELGQRAEQLSKLERPLREPIPGESLTPEGQH